MKHAYVFPGQGAQFSGMGKDLYNNNVQARELFEQANSILGFRITDIMFDGSAEELRQTRVTQPAVFLHSVILAKTLGVAPDAVAGHSLGEFSALVIAGALSFEEGLRLVAKRAEAMQAACEATSGTMAAIIGLEDEVVEKVCEEVNSQFTIHNSQLIPLRGLFLLAARHSANKFALCACSAASVVNSLAMPSVFLPFRTLRASGHSISNSESRLCALCAAGTYRVATVRYRHRR